MNRKTLLAIFVTAALVISVGASAQNIDTTPSWDGSNYVQTFGYPNTAAYGQTITAPPAGATLQSFTFYMNLPASCTFQGEVYAWDGSKATGAALWEGPSTQTSGSGNFEAITFTPGGISLAPSTQYVLFASVSKLSGSGGGRWGLVADVYSGGSFVFINCGSDPGGWTSGSWASWSNDLAFKADLGGGGSTYDLSFMDDYGRSEVCVNSSTGDWQWSVLRDPGAGKVYTGTGTVTNTGGNMLFRATAGSGYGFSLWYYAGSHRAVGAFTYGPDRITSGLYDMNTANDETSCGGGTQPTVR